MDQKYETLKEAGYTFIRKDEANGYLLQENETKNLEWWFANKNHAGYGIKFRGTHLEFARSADKNEAHF